MSSFHYRPASATGWLAVASEAQLLVVHPLAAELSVAVFAQASADATQGIQAALDELTRGGLSATPPFALLEWSGIDRNALRVIVRGGVQAVITAAGTTHTMDGTGVSSWTEQNFQQVTGFDVVVVPAPDDIFAQERWLPLDRGIAVVSRISSAHQQGAKDGVPDVSAPVNEPTAMAVSETTMADFPSGVPELDSDARPTDAGYDYLFGETMYRDVADAAAHEPGGEAEPATSTQAGDHDGMTIMTHDLKKLRGGRKATPPPPAPAPTTELFLEMSTGSRESLVQPVLVGRAPTANKVSGTALPRLVTIPGDKDISRNHARFAVEGGTVVVTDLHSRNGTQVIMPGKAPQQLRQGEPTAVIVGTVVDLGGGVTLTVREEG